MTDAPPDEDWGELLAPGEGTLDSILEILSDRDFVDACISPKDVETGALEALSQKANRTLQAFINEEISRRIEAGLYTIDDKYRPGEPYVSHGKEGEFLNYQLAGNEVKLVELNRSEYPWIHELQENVNILRADLAARANRNSVTVDEPR